MNFPVKAKRIWSEKYEDNTFIMFKANFFTKAKSNIVLNVSACHYYCIYINGEFVYRLSHRYFDFAKQYQSIDIDKHIISGNNTVAVLCYAQNTFGFMAEICAKNQILFFTDENTKCKLCKAYNSLAPSHALLFGIEEQFDANLFDYDWTLYDFGGWSFSKEVIGQNEWINFNKSETCALTNEKIYGKNLVALQLAKRKDGQKFNLIKQKGITVFVTELICVNDTKLTLYASNLSNFISDNISLITVDSSSVIPGDSKNLSAGKHLLVITLFNNAEILLQGDFSVSAKAFLREDFPFAIFTIPSVDVKFPWHEQPFDIIRKTPLILLAHQCMDSDKLLSILDFSFQIGQLGNGSSYFNVVTQDYFIAKNCFISPQIQKTESYKKIEKSLIIKSPESLTTVCSEPFVIKESNGFDVNFILDLGHEYIGYVDFEISAAKGTLLEVQCYELIDRVGCYYMDNMNGFSYVCRDGYQHFTSNYRRGCRYISVTIRNIQREIRLYSLSLIHTVAKNNMIGSFQSDDYLLNKIYEMSRDTASLCMLDTYVDCPGHEQNFWVGDARITALINLINFGNYKFNQHSVRMVGQSLSKDYVTKYFPDDRNFNTDRFLSMAAYAAYPPASSLPIWSFLWVMQCYEHYIYGGNLSHLKENYSYVKKNLENASNFINKRGLFDYPGAWNLIEWAANDISPYGECTANNIFLKKSFELAAKMAGFLGISEDSREFTGKAENLCNAINLYCWDKERNAYVDTVRDEFAYTEYLKFCENENYVKLNFEQYLSLSRISEQTNCFAILYDVADAGRKEHIMPILTRIAQRQYIMSSPAQRSIGEPKPGEVVDGIVATGSPFFLFFALDALYKIENFDMAEYIIKSDWGAMLENGTNTCWETFMPSNPQSHITRSIAHAWSASPAIYLIQEVLGVKPASPGYKQFKIAPCKSNLNWVKGSVATPYGPIFVSWIKDNSGVLKIEYSAPAECELLYHAEYQQNGVKICRIN